MRQIPPFYGAAYHVFGFESFPLIGLTEYKQSIRYIQTGHNVKLIVYLLSPNLFLQTLMVAYLLNLSDEEK